jgi:hypothetical protein
MKITGSIWIHTQNRTPAPTVNIEELQRDVSPGTNSNMASLLVSPYTIAPLAHAHTDRVGTNRHMDAATMLSSISIQNIPAQPTAPFQEPIDFKRHNIKGNNNVTIRTKSKLAIGSML